ncbi:MAG TPA: hypothetical protein VM925_27320, partial [Labilithrix sp.]|nr:hypothetical protein [Labilithrix sp.]
MTPRQKLYVFVALFLVTAFAACTLNPQPLPPAPIQASSDDARDAGSSSFGGADSATTGSYPPAKDAGEFPSPDLDGGDADDAGDAGDASDAGQDAGDDAGDV